MKMFDEDYATVRKIATTIGASLAHGIGSENLVRRVTEAAVDGALNALTGYKIKVDGFGKFADFEIDIRKKE